MIIFSLLGHTKKYKKEKYVCDFIFFGRWRQHKREKGKKRKITVESLRYFVNSTHNYSFFLIFTPFIASRNFLISPWAKHLMLSKIKDQFGPWSNPLNLGHLLCHPQVFSFFFFLFSIGQWIMPGTRGNWVDLPWSPRWRAFSPNCPGSFWAIWGEMSLEHSAKSLPHRPLHVHHFVSRPFFTNKTFDLFGLWPFLN